MAKLKGKEALRQMRNDLQLSRTTRDLVLPLLLAGDLGLEEELDHVQPNRPRLYIKAARLTPLQERLTETFMKEGERAERPVEIDTTQSSLEVALGVAGKARKHSPLIRIRT
jgi:hypothetical protein